MIFRSRFGWKLTYINAEAETMSAAEDLLGGLLWNGSRPWSVDFQRSYEG